MADIFDFLDTWNKGAGVTHNGLKLNVTDVASAAASKLIDLQVGAASRFSVNKAGDAVIVGTVAIGASGAQAQLAADAANVLALRNGASAQTANVYNTYTDASNYEVGYARWAGNVFQVGTGKLGTGAARSLSLETDGTSRWQLGTTGHLIAAADNTYDIGAVGATRPRTIYAATSVIGGDITAAAAGRLEFSTRTRLASPADGVLTMWNAAAGDFSRLQFGGTTASFPALKRSATMLQVRLADDTDDAPLSASYVKLKVLTVATLPAAGTAGSGSRAFVSNANATTFASIVAAGGTNQVPVYSDGTNWRIG